MESQPEIWMPVKGYEGFYEVSNLGRIKGLPRVKRTCDKIYLTSERMLKPNKNNKGYYQIPLRDEFGFRKYWCVHKLVLIAFMPNPENKPQGNHKNGIKSDCNINNLEWVTQSENTKHAIKMGLFTPPRAKTRLGLQINKSVAYVE